MGFRISDMLVLHVNYITLCCALNRRPPARISLLFVVAVGARSVVAFRVMVVFTPSDVKDVGAFQGPIVDRGENSRMAIV